MKNYFAPAAFALLCATLTQPAFAEDGINEQALKACSFIENDFRRLLCYDNVVANKPIDAPRAQSKGNDKAAVAAATGSAVAAKQASSNNEFGLEHKKEHEEADQDLVANVAKIKEAPRGELIITLDNGQVWRQLGTESFRLSKNDEVIISRAMFNSFLLKKAGSNKTIRVKRTD